MPVSQIPEQPPRRPRLLRGLGAALGVIAAAGALAAGWLSAAERFPLRTVRLDSKLVKVEERELRQATLPYLDRGLLELDVARVRQAVEALPWVAAASVRRRWPDTLVIGVTERVAVARWNDAVIDGDGVVFRPRVDTIPDGLPVLEGPAGSVDGLWQRFRRLREVFGRAGLELTALRMDERRAWTAGLAGGATVQLGVDDTDAAAERFAQALPRIAAPGDARLARVDLRYPNGFALAWADAAPRNSGKKQ